MAGKRSNPNDEAELERIRKEAEKGGDPFGDNEELVAESHESRAKKAAAEQAEQADPADTADVDQDAAVAAALKAAEEGDKPAEEAKAEDEPKDEGEEGGEDKGEETAQTDDAKPADDAEDEDVDFAEPAQYTGKPIADLEKEANELRAKRTEAFEKYSDGDPEWDGKKYAALDADTQSKLEAVNRQIARAESRMEAVADYQNGILKQIKVEAKKAGLDYDDKKAIMQFDAALRAIAVGDDSGKRSFRSMAREAHATVLAVRGISKAAESKPKAKEEAKPAAKKPEPPPPREAKRPALTTLRNVPAAATPNTGNSMRDAFAGLKGPKFQEAFSKLSPQQRAKLLDE